MKRKRPNIVVPEAMVRAACARWDEIYLDKCELTDEEIYFILEGGLRWLTRYPRVPTTEQADRLWAIALDREQMEHDHAAKNLAAEWGRMMFVERL